jgi:hypothetical protein
MLLAMLIMIRTVRPITQLPQLLDSFAYRHVAGKTGPNGRRGAGSHMVLGRSGSRGLDAKGSTSPATWACPPNSPPRKLTATTRTR